jgi:hypothetical protein
VDAHLTRPESQGGSRQEEQDTLEGLLKASKEKTLTMLDFKNRTADILGPPVLAEEVQSHYRQVTEGFLGRARAALMRDGTAGLQVATTDWQQMMRLIGRRAGHVLEKQVLDILSYECRAAFHRCYSATWCYLLPRLAEKYGLDQPTLSFLRFWHLDHCSESAEGPHAYFHLFHGHIFGLHPSSGAMLQTPTGRENLAAWLSQPDSEAAFGRLLHAIFVALYHYVGQRDTSSDCRRKQPISRSDNDVLELERQMIGKVKRRRRSRIRPADAR